jgi:hypothetical protein
MWQEGGFNRKDIYTKLSIMLKRKYHTAQLRSVEECEAVISKLLEMKRAIHGEEQELPVM